MTSTLIRRLRKSLANVLFAFAFLLIDDDITSEIASELAAELEAAWTLEAA
jgi:hypothetical protein